LTIPFAGFKGALRRVHQYRLAHATSTIPYRSLQALPPGGCRVRNPAPQPDREPVFDPHFPQLDLRALTSLADKQARHAGLTGDCRADFAADIVAAVLARWHKFNPAKGPADRFLSGLVANSAFILRRDAAAQKRQPTQAHVPLAGAPEPEERETAAERARVDLALDIADLVASMPNRSARWVARSLQKYRDSERPPRAPDAAVQISVKFHFSPLAPIGRAKRRKD
jgi:hypothetical protein